MHNAKLTNFLYLCHNSTYVASLDCGYTVAAHQFRSFFDTREYITYNRTPKLCKISYFVSSVFNFFYLIINTLRNNVKINLVVVYEVCTFVKETTTI